jgi:hypothetical protein
MRDARPPALPPRYKIQDTRPPTRPELKVESPRGWVRGSCILHLGGWQGRVHPGSGGAAGMQLFPLSSVCMYE